MLQITEATLICQTNSNYDYSLKSGNYQATTLRISYLTLGHKMYACV